MGVQTLMMLQAHPKIRNTLLCCKLVLELAPRILDKHQILPIQPRKFLLIFTLYRRLDWRLQSVFDLVNDISNGEVF